MNENAKRAVSVMLTALCGIGVVTFETPQNFLLLSLWLGITVAAIRRLRQKLQGRQAGIAAVIHGSAMVGIIAVAAFAPVKRIDVVKERVVQLQATNMTVAQLADYCELHRKSLPLRISIQSHGQVADSELHFAADHMTLRQFIEQIERQTELKARFVGCGNAYSVLYGGGYSFGLSFIPNPDSGYKL